MTPEEQGRVRLTELILENRTALYGFILAQVPNAHAAEDILQDVCMVISQKWATYDPQRSFRSWAFGIARNKILQHYEREKRSKIVLLDSDLLEQVAVNPNWDREDSAEKETLRECMKKLSGKVRFMLRLHYFENLTAKAMSLRMRWGARSISVALTRARTALMECVDAKLSQARSENS
jgi:RNA polymerase sigma-70 factor, ECF subfamily